MSVQQTVIDVMKLSVTTFFNSVDEAVDLLTFSLDENANIITVVENVSNLLAGVALTVISFLFLIDLIQNVLMKMEDLRYEDVVKVLMKMLFAKMFSSYMSLLILGIYGRITSIITQVSKKVPLATIEEGINNTIKLNVPSGFIQATIFLLCNIFPMILLLLCGIIVKVMAYARMFEFFVLVAISPIASSFLPYKGTSDITKRFILGVVSVLLQGLVMLISIQIYGKIMTGFNYNVGIFELLIKTSTMSCVLLMAISSSGKWAKQVVGLN